MKRYLPHLVLLFAVLFAVSPFFSSNFGGYRPDQFPVVQDRWPIQPAGWAFSIWGVIYLWLIAGSAWGLWKAKDDPDWQAMRAPLAISLFIGIFWLAAALASPVLATVMIIAMAATAIQATLRAGTQDRWWQVAPVGLYTGWLTAASGVSVGIVLGGYGLLSPTVAAWLMILVTLAVALWVQSRRPGLLTYPLAVIWALAGIVAANWGTETSGVAILAGIGIIPLAAQYLLRGRPA